MIPRRIFQFWFGPLPPPSRLMDVWRTMNPTFDYVTFRDDKRMIGHGFAASGEPVTLGDGSPWPNQDAQNRMEEWGGKTDLARYAVLERWGSIYVDSDAVALRPLDGELLEHEVWAVYENEVCRPGVITGAFLGSVPGSALMRELVELVGKRDMREIAWKSVGPTFLTEVARRHPELHVYPSRTFIPHHYTGAKGVGDVEPYADHVWGNTLHATYERAPGIACVIPCYGQARFLHEAVASVLAQTVRVDEIVIVCGDGESETAAKGAGGLEVYESGSPRITILRGHDRGVGEARNAGIAACSASTLFCLDADDALEPTWLETLLSHAQGARFVVGCDMRTFGDRESVYAFPKPVGRLLNENTISACTLFTRDLWEAVGGYDVALLGAEDWDFWIRCSQRKPKIAMLEQSLLRYRVHADQMMERDRRAGLPPLWRAIVFAKNPEIYTDPKLRAAAEVVIRAMDRATRARLEARRASFPDSPTLARLFEILDAPTAATIPVTGMHPEEESATWRPEITGLLSDGILTFYRRIAPTLPKGARCVEVGCYVGRSLLYLVELLHTLGNLTAQVQGVDTFAYYARSFERLQENAEKVVGDRMPDGPRLAIHPTTSTIAAANVLDGSLDLVFIDADHSEAGVLADLHAWVPKVRPSDRELGVGGIVAGHDLCADHPGVESALLKFFGPGRVKYEGSTCWSVQL